MVHVSLEDDWHILKVRDRARHDTASESPASFRRSTACCVIPDLLTTIILLSRDNTLQADLDSATTQLAAAKAGSDGVYPLARSLKRAADECVHYVVCGDRERSTEAMSTLATELAALVALLTAEGTPAHLRRGGGSGGGGWARPPGSWRWPCWRIPG